MITIHPSTTADIPLIQSIAKITWPLTFAPLMTEPQLNYMMHMMYSTEALQHQMGEEKHIFLLVEKDEKPLGYCSYEPHFRNSKKMMMHKLYLLPSAQGMGIGRTVINHLMSIAKEMKQKSLRLQVLHSNIRAASFYKRMGFKKTGEENKVLGNNMGSFLDYVLEKEV